MNDSQPGDFLVKRSTKQLVFNLKIAEAPGLEVPATLLACADEVIEEVQLPYLNEGLLRTDGLRLRLSLRDFSRGRRSVRGGGDTTRCRPVLHTQGRDRDRPS